MNERRIVVVNFTRMGDLIQSGPLLSALKFHHRDARLTLVVFEKFREAASCLPMVDDVIGFDVDPWVGLLDSSRGDLPKAYEDLNHFLADARLNHPYAVYNLSHTPLSATLCGLMDATENHGMIRDASGDCRVHGEWFNYLLSIMQERTFNPFNLVEIYLRFAGKTRTRFDLALTVKAEDRLLAVTMLQRAGIELDKPFVVLQPGASCTNRQWPVDRFAELARLLDAEGIQSVVVGSAEERDLGEQLVRVSDGKARSVVGQSSIGTLAAILESASHLVSNDTGTIHLSAAVGTPSIGIYLGPAAAKDTAPYGTGHVIIEANLPCAPCGYHDSCAIPLCHHAVSAGDVAALLFCDESERQSVAAGLHHLRIMRTVVEDDGSFRLEPLNRAAADSGSSSFQRSFWDSLLGWGGTAADTVSPDVTGMSASDLDRLGQILDTARCSSRDLQCAAASHENLREALSQQLVWQNELRAMMMEAPRHSWFPRFLLTKLSTARAHDLSGYVEDIGATVDLFERGISLMTSPDRRPVKMVHADAE